MREELEELLHEQQYPGLYFVLEMDVNTQEAETDAEETLGTVEWTCFRDGGPFRGSIDEAVANLYLAHLAQWCQIGLYAPEKTVVGRLKVLDPREFVEYLRDKRRQASGLAKTIRNADTVDLQTGEWRNRREVILWQASLAVWRKRAVAT